MSNCKSCGKPLNESQRKGELKSCPRCSEIDGNEHIYFHESDFGFTDKRITKKNPDGIQSYCSIHRPQSNSQNPVPNGGIKCSELCK